MRLRSLCFVAGGVVIVGIGLNVELQRQNARLRSRVAATWKVEDEPGPVRGPAPRSSQTVVAQSASGSTELITPTVADDIAPLRTEIAMLEKRAQANYVARSESKDRGNANADADAERAMTRLEDLKNRGSLTPGAALQTLFWAVVKGEDKVLDQSLYLDDGAREAGLQFLAELPEAEKTRWSTPEKIEALILARTALNVSAIQIVDTKFTSPYSASVTVRGLTGGDEVIPMAKGAAGWQLFVGKGQMEWAVQQVPPKGKD